MAEVTIAPLSVLQGKLIVVLPTGQLAVANCVHEARDIARACIAAWPVATRGPIHINWVAVKPVEEV